MSIFFKRSERYFLKHEKIFLTLFLLFFAILYSYISIAKHNRFETFGWDLAFQDQLIWKWSHFQVAYMSLKDNINSLGDHFTLTWIFLVPFYWIKPDPKTLLATQAFVAVFTAWPLYFFGKKLLKSSLLSLSVCLMFILFISLQESVFNDVHSTVYTGIFITLAYYFIELKRWRWYLLSAFLLSVTKEEYGLLVAAIGVVILIKKKAVWPGIVSIIYGIAIFFFLTVFLMPHLSNTPKFVHSYFGQLGNSTPQAAQTIIERPDLLIKGLFDDPVKRDTIFRYFAGFGFLPILSPVDLIPIAQQIIIRFLDSYHFVRWRSDNHYSAPAAALLAISTIYGLANLMIRFKKKVKFNLIAVLTIFVVIVAFGQNIIWHGPVNSIFKRQFYERYPWMNDNEQIISMVPKGVSVATNNDLAPHLSERDNIYLLPDVKGADYVAVDLLDGPNKYAPTDFENTMALIEKMKKDPDYVLVKQSGKAYLFRKIGSSSPANYYEEFFRPQPL